MLDFDIVAPSTHQSLQLKMHGQGFPWWRVLLMVLVFVAGFIAHDVRSQGSFADSTTALYLERSGVTAVSQQAWIKVSHYGQQGVRSGNAASMR